MVNTTISYGFCNILGKLSRNIAKVSHEHMNFKKYKEIAHYDLLIYVDLVQKLYGKYPRRILQNEVIV